MDYVILNYCADTGRFTVGCAADLHNSVLWAAARCDDERDLWTAIDVLHVGYGETRTLQVHYSLLPAIERLAADSDKPAASSDKLTVEKTQRIFGGTLTDYQAAVYTELHNCE